MEGNPPFFDSISRMERKVPFSEGEYYHIYSRGVEKRQVFLNPGEYERFQLLLRLCNTKEPVHMANFFKRHEGFAAAQMFEYIEPGEVGRLTEIAAYALMPNHIHLIVREREKGGISKFMLKLMTAYSTYFNLKHKRSGPLFTRPFRSKHLDTDEYARWAFSYVTLNPLALFQSDWEERGVQDISAAGAFLRTYRFASFLDYLDAPRPESIILAKDALPLALDMRDMDSMLKILATRA